MTEHQEQLLRLLGDPANTLGTLYAPDRAAIRAAMEERAALLTSLEALTAWWGEDGEADMDRLCRTWEDAFAAVAEARGQS